MSHKEFHGTVNFNVSTGLIPWGDPSEYVHSVVGCLPFCAKASEDLLRIHARLATDQSLTDETFSPV